MMRLAILACSVLWLGALGDRYGRKQDMAANAETAVTGPAVAGAD
jgi:hypothetical protein